MTEEYKKREYRDIAKRLYKTLKQLSESNTLRPVYGHACIFLEHESFITYVMDGLLNKSPVTICTSQFTKDDRESFLAGQSIAGRDLLKSTADTLKYVCELNNFHIKRINPDSIEVHCADRHICTLYESVTESSKIATPDGLFVPEVFARNRKETKGTIKPFSYNASEDDSDLKILNWLKVGFYPNYVWAPEVISEFDLRLDFDLRIAKLLRSLSDDQIRRLARFGYHVAIAELNSRRIELGEVATPYEKDDHLLNNEQNNQQDKPMDAKEAESIAESERCVRHTQRRAESIAEEIMKAIDHLHLGKKGFLIADSASHFHFGILKDQIVKSLMEGEIPKISFYINPNDPNCNGVIQDDGISKIIYSDILGMGSPPTSVRCYTYKAVAEISVNGKKVAFLENQEYDYPESLFATCYSFESNRIYFPKDNYNSFSFTYPVSSSDSFETTLKWLNKGWIDPHLNYFEFFKEKMQKPGNLQLLIEGIHTALSKNPNRHLLTDANNKSNAKEEANTGVSGDITLTTGNVANSSSAGSEEEDKETSITEEEIADEVKRIKYAIDHIHSKKLGFLFGDYANYYHFGILEEQLAKCIREGKVPQIYIQGDPELLQKDNIYFGFPPKRRPFIPGTKIKDKSSIFHCSSTRRVPGRMRFATPGTVQNPYAKVGADFVVCEHRSNDFPHELQNTYYSIDNGKVCCFFREGMPTQPFSYRVSGVDTFEQTIRWLNNGWFDPRCDYYEQFSEAINGSVSNKILLSKALTNAVRNYTQYLIKNSGKALLDRQTSQQNEDQSEQNKVDMSTERPERVDAEGNQRKTIALLKDRGTKAAFRIASRRLTAAAQTGILSILKKNGANNEVLEFMEKFMGSDFGNAFIAGTIGVALPQIPQVNQDSRVQLLAEELQVEGLTVAGDKIMMELSKYLLPGILEAIQELPELESPKSPKEEKKIRVFPGKTRPAWESEQEELEQEELEQESAAVQPVRG